MSFLRSLSFRLLAICCALAGCSSPRPLAQMESRPQDPILASTIKARVLVFVSNDCPLANRYCPEIRRLHERYAPRGVAFWLVHSDPQETLASINDHDREYGLTLPIMMDSSQSLAKLARVEVVPSAALFDSHGALLYHGRIDDRFVEIGRERVEASRHDLAEAVEAVLAGRPVSTPETKTVGCYIPGLR